MNIFKKCRTFLKDSFGQKLPRPDILLITGPPWGVNSPPLGLAYLVTYLRSHNIPAGVFDANIALYRWLTPEWHKLWLPEYKNWWSNNSRFSELLPLFSEHIDRSVQLILEQHAPVLGFSVVDPKERFTIEMIKRIKKLAPDTKILLGGPAVSTPEQRAIFVKDLNGMVDYFVVGPGEEILLEIMNNYRQGNFASPLNKPKDGSLTVHKEIQDIKTIPFPTYNEFDLGMYDGGGVMVEWSRGCISKCAYCKGRSLLGHYQMKSPEHIVRELEYLHGTYNYTHFIVCDNLLNGNTAGLENLCDLLISRNLQITWEGQGIPYRRTTRSLLKKMRRAGCVKMQWGLESGSDKVLLNIDKGLIFTVSHAAEVIRNSHAAGLQTEIFLIIGLPGEDEAEFAKTKAFIQENSASIDCIKSINTLHLVHGTKLYDQAEERYGLLLPESGWYYLWSSRVGTNTYPTRVKRAKELLHLADSLSIPVLSHNLMEGEERKERQ